MYYNTDTERAINIDEIARQCREAITRGTVRRGYYAPITNTQNSNGKT